MVGYSRKWPATGRELGSPQRNSTSATPAALLNRRYTRWLPGRNTADGVDPVTGPVARDQPIPRIPKDELVVRHPLAVGVAEIHQPGRGPMQPNRLHPIPIEIAHKRLIPRIPKDIRHLSSPQPTVIVAQPVDHKHPRLHRPIDRHRVTPIPIEVPHNRDITRIPEEEPDIGHPLGIRIPQIHKPIRLAIHPRRLHPITIPIPHHRNITRIPEIEPHLPTSRTPQPPQPQPRIHQPHRGHGAADLGIGRRSCGQGLGRGPYLQGSESVPGSNPTGPRSELVQSMAWRMASDVAWGTALRRDGGRASDMGRGHRRAFEGVDTPNPVLNGLLPDAALAAGRNIAARSHQRQHSARAAVERPTEVSVQRADGQHIGVVGRVCQRPPIVAGGGDEQGACR